MAYTARLTKQQLRHRRDATRYRSRDNMKGTVQYLVTYAYTNNNCLLCASNIIVSVAISTDRSRDRERRSEERLFQTEGPTIEKALSCLVAVRESGTTMSPPGG